MIVLGVQAVCIACLDEADQIVESIGAFPGRLEAALLVEFGEQVAGRDIDILDAEPVGMPQLFDFHPDRFAIVWQLGPR